MSESTIFAILVFIFFVFLLIYKRDVLVQLFQVNSKMIAAPTNELQEQLERTADNVIKRLEDPIEHIKSLMDKADAKIEKLDKKVHQAEDVIRKQEEEKVHLESIVEETVAKIELLDKQIQHFEEMIEQQNNKLIPELTSVHNEIPADVPPIQSEPEVVPQVEEIPQVEEEIAPLAISESIEIPVTTSEVQVESVISDIKEPVIQINENESDTKNQTKNIVNHDKRRLIFAMADQGYNVLEIAKATGLGKGEVMLLLQLNKNKKLVIHNKLWYTKSRYKSHVIQFCYCAEVSVETKDAEYGGKLTGGGMLCQ